MDVRSNADPESPDHGTVFTLRIPVSIAPAGDSRKPMENASGVANRSGYANPGSRGSIATNIEMKEID